MEKIKGINLGELKEVFKKEYDLDFKIGDNKIYCDEFNGYINDDDTYLDIEEFCNGVCDYIERKYDCFTSFEVLGEGYEFIIELF